VPRLINSVNKPLRRSLKGKNVILFTGLIADNDINPSLHIHLTHKIYSNPSELTQQRDLVLQSATMDEWVKLISNLGQSRVHVQVPAFEGSIPRSTDAIVKDLLFQITEHVNSKGAAEQLIRNLDQYKK
jgi:hypothetical protein